jgi:hypothetical protein
MSKQDNEATIECCCIVIRAHMIDADKKKNSLQAKYDVFKDIGSFSKISPTKINGIETSNNIFGGDDNMNEKNEKKIDDKDSTLPNENVIL